MGRPLTDKVRPTKHLTKEHIVKMAEITEERKEEALDENHTIKLHYGFKNQKALWQNANEEDRHAIVYGMAFFDGAIKKGMSDIARFFGLEPKELKPYHETFEMAKIALKLKIQRNVISLGLQREDMVNLKFNLLLQYAEQTVNPQHEGVESIDETKPITINVITKDTVPQGPNETTVSNAASDYSSAGSSLQ